MYRQGQTDKDEKPELYAYITKYVISQHTLLTQGASTNLGLLWLLITITFPLRCFI